MFLYDKNANITCLFFLSDYNSKHDSLAPCADSHVVICHSLLFSMSNVNYPNKVYIGGTEDKINAFSLQ